MKERAEKELEKLLEGNKNFVNGTPTAQNMSLETLQKYAFHQEPYACVLTCSARLSDVGPGDKLNTISLPH